MVVITLLWRYLYTKSYNKYSLLKLYNVCVVCMFTVVCETNIESLYTKYMCKKNQDKIEKVKFYNFNMNKMEKNLNWKMKKNFYWIIFFFILFF